MNKKSILFILFFLFLTSSLSGKVKNLVICDTEKEPVAGAIVISYDSHMDSIGTARSSFNGIVTIDENSAKYVTAEHAQYESRLVHLSSLRNDTIVLKRGTTLGEVTVQGERVTEHLSHDSYRLSQASMEPYTNFYQALNEIPNLVVLGSGALFYEGDQNVALLLNGVESTREEISSISKSDISRIDIYRTPPARFLVQGYAAVVDVITKSSLTGGTGSLDLEQSFFPLKGDNSAALYYNYRQSKFSLLFNNSNSHFSRYRVTQDLDYTYDGVEYNKHKEGLDSKIDEDENTLKLTFQNNKKGSYLYNLNIAGALNRERNNLRQLVTSNLTSQRFDGYNRLSTGLNKVWIGNYFEKNLDADGEKGKIMANIKLRRFFSRYFSSYSEFNEGETETPVVDESSAYRIRFDAIFTEVQYEFPKNKWGQMFIDAYNTYYYSKYTDIKKPIYQRNNNFGASFQCFGKINKLSYTMMLGVSNLYVRSSTLDKKISLWIPDPFLSLTYSPMKKFRLNLNYYYRGKIPSVAWLSETDQWVDTRLVYHGNSLLKPYKEHSVSLRGTFSSRYFNGSLTAGYVFAPDRICNYYMETENYLLETMVNLQHYSEIYGQLDITIKPLGRNIWTIWSRIIGAKVHGRGDTYKWDGYRFQWMMNTRLNLRRWTFELFYQYPGRIAEGMLIRPRAQSWYAQAFYRPVTNLSVGLEWFMPFGKGFVESERTVGTALAHNFYEINIRDRANMLSLKLIWNFSFGKNKNSVRPSFDNDSMEDVFLKK